MVYKQNHAHPAYKITLLYTEPIRNPYDHPALFNQLLELEEVRYPKLSKKPRLKFTAAAARLPLM